jgi:signal transduction histidine kinase
MVREFLENISLFNNLTETDFGQICGMVEEVRLSAGEELFSEGSSGDRAYIIQDGEIEVLKISSGREILLSVHGSGSVIGEMALLEKAPRMASVRARTNSTLLAISKEQFDQLLNTSPTAARTMLDTVLARWRNTTARLQQSERMAQLGTLSAGVAHELNNPAAAVTRGAEQLQDAIAQYEWSHGQLYQFSFSDTQWETLRELSRNAQTQATHPPVLDALTRSDREAELETWLEAKRVDDAWEYASILVNLEYDDSELAALAENFASDQLPAVICWLSSTYRVRSLLTEIGQGAGRISEIIKALKSYSYLDQGPVQAVDVHEGLDNTLVILQNKFKAGISVRRDYAPELPTIHAYGSELNQVWTNILDNAADALDGRGEIVIRTRQDGEWVVVEIEDNGSGIPPEIQPRLFDPFFTTKRPGKGTGLGLDISYNIVVHKHRGDIKVTSQPGKTSFEIWLPINFEAR